MWQVTWGEVSFSAHFIFTPALAPADPRTHEDLRRGPVRDSQCSEIAAHAPGCGGGPRAHGGRQLRQAAV